MAQINSNRFLYALVFVVGVSTLGAEIAAARLMAPYFGASTIVWANTIGVVLVALSIGYWLGGRMGDRYPRSRELCITVLIAAALLAVVPFAAKPFFEVSADALDEISAGAFVGSLVGVLFLIAVPLVMLGTCSPWAIRLAVPDVEHAGRTAGRLYAISTFGSLFGTMLSALVLIPFIGTQRTFLVFAIALALIAAAGLGWRYLVVPIALALVLAVPVGSSGATDGGEVIWEGETEEQYIRVVEQDDGDRQLVLNEGQAVHSVYDPDTVLTGDVWDGYLVLPVRGPRRAAREDRDPRQRGRHHRPRLRRVLPRDRDRRRRDRREADRAGGGVLRPRQPEPDDPPRGRAAVAARRRRRLRRDHGRRLPPALHPLLPRDQGVLRAGRATTSRPEAS